MTRDPKIGSAIGFLIHDEAQRAGREWSLAGIQTSVRGALDDDGRDVLSVVLAGFQAVSDAKAETPGAIRWPARYTRQTKDLEVDGPRCRTCKKQRHVHDAVESKLNPEHRHPFEAIP